MSMESLPDGYRAAVFGASGGIGGAFVDLLVQDPRCAVVHAGSRGPASPTNGKVAPFAFDLTDTDSIAHAAEQIGDVDMVIVATGILHGDGLLPEKTVRAIDPAAMAQVLAINAIGPALIARHLLPRMSRERRTLFAALSAKVGSISDNQLGGWYSYRASKAALNQLVRTLAVEVSRTHPRCVCVALHPGTVDTPLSRPFQTGVAAGRLFSPQRAAQQLLSVLDGLGPDSSGRLIGWDGHEISP